METASNQPGLPPKKAGQLALIGLGTVAALVLVPYVYQDTPRHELVKPSLYGLGGGLVCLVFGFRAFRRRQLMRNTPTSKIRSLAVGTAEIKAIAHPVEEPLVSPLSRTEACLYELDVKEKRTDEDGDTYWKTVIELREETPFYLDDGTGRVLVDPEEADLNVKTEAEERVDSHEPPPAALETWLEREDRAELDTSKEPDEWMLDTVEDLIHGSRPEVGEPKLAGTSLRERRYEERVLAAGESAYVFGAADIRDGVAHAQNERNLVLTDDPSTGQFVISDKREQRLVNEKLAGAAFLLAVALVGVPYGIIGFLRVLGAL